MPKFYRKRPVEIEAMPILEDLNHNEMLAEWCGGQLTMTFDGKPGILIKTLEGEMLGGVGDYIIKGVKGEFYPCKADIFHATYEEV